MKEIENDLAIVDTYAKIDSIMEKYKGKNVYISYSGGSDSDTIAYLFKNKGYDLPLVFFDTGMEYSATKEHVQNMKEDGFDIRIVKPKKSIGVATRKYGIPFISKFVSEMLYRLQKHEFDFFTDGKKDSEYLLKKFPNAQGAVKWWCNVYGSGKFNIKQNKLLKEFLIQNGLPFKVSGKCCDFVKKSPAKHFAKENKMDLAILGIRKSEGGIRAGMYKNCFITKKSLSYSMYFPIFWWSNEIKDAFDEEFNIQHSKCYSQYNLKRTGCAGCPFGRGFENELEMLERYDPKLNKAVLSMFEDSYTWTRKYNDFKNNIK